MSFRETESRMMAEKQYDGVIFDFNGVLLWDNHLHEEAWRRFSERLRGVPMSIDEMKVAVHGRVNRDILEYVLGRRPDDDETHVLAGEKETLYRRLAMESPETYRLSPGAAELLDYLVANNIPRAIATSSPPGNVAFFIEHLDLLHWFTPEHIVHDRGLYPGKPGPGIYLEAAACLGLHPNRCMVVEDAVMGIESANNAGIGAIVGISTTESRNTLAALPGVQVVIPDLGSFPRHILKGGIRENRSEFRIVNLRN